MTRGDNTALWVVLAILLVILAGLAFFRFYQPAEPADNDQTTIIEQTVPSPAPTQDSTVDLETVPPITASPAATASPATSPTE